MENLQLAGAIITLIGSLFLFLGSLGLVRMPDVFNRIQAGTKATTLGTILALCGIGIAHLEWFPKLVVLIGFVLITNPVSSHVLARAAHFVKKPSDKLAVIDKLSESQEES